METPRILPHPVAIQCRRAENAKSPKERHDTAYFAWEASIKLAVVNNPPANPAPLARGSLGHWVNALNLPATKLTDRALLDCAHLFTDRQSDSASAFRSIRARDLFEALTAYRNRIIAHGATRNREFYDHAGEVLLHGLAAAWHHEVFWSADSRLVYVESVELDPQGQRRARLLDLTGEIGRIDDPRGTPGIPDDLVPRRLYRRTRDGFRCLHPWLLYEESGYQERIYFFNGLGRGPRYLNYASGEILGRSTIQRLYPTAEKSLADLFREAPAMADGPPEESSVREAAEDETLVGDFRLVGRLGEGGMGVVHLALQESLGRLVALKLLPENLAGDPIAVARFKQEIDALSRCEHANVVKILCSGEYRSTLYYAMEYVEGVSLDLFHGAAATAADLDTAISVALEASRDRRERRPAESDEATPTSPTASDPTVGRPSATLIKRLASLLAQAAQGVDHLHEHGVIHRDLKPSNLMLTVSDQRIVVMDLGLAKIREATRSITLDRSRIVGTLRYIAPEQLQRNLVQVDQRADIYSLGAAFYELMTGRPIFDGDTDARLIEQVLRERPTSPRVVNSAIPRDLNTVLLKAVEKDPKLRYPDARSLADDVERFLAGRPVSAQPPTPLYLLRLAIRRNLALVSTVAASVVVIIVLLGLYGWSRHRAWKEASYRLDVATAANLLTEVREPTRLHPDSAPFLVKRIATIEHLAAKLPRFRARAAELGGEASKGPLGKELQSLITRIETLKTTFLPRDRIDLDLVQSLETVSLEKASEIWKRAIDDINSLPVYKGIGRVAPQLGLVPLRCNEEGYWEFWHVASGTRPTVRPDTTALVLKPENGIILVLLPGGRFKMGSAKNSTGHRKGERLHVVPLKPFFIGKFEVTQAQWLRTLGGENPSNYPAGDDRIKSDDGAIISSLHPVENITARAADLFAQRLVLILPTEAQWEYAARAGSTLAYPMGDDPRCLEGEENVADESLTRVSQTAARVAPWRDGFPVHAPVGSFGRNAFGLYDVLGNVQEWTADVLGEYPPDCLEPSDGRNTKATGRLRVARGGCWGLHPWDARCAHRHYYDPSDASASRGLRVARPLTR